MRRHLGRVLLYCGAVSIATAAGGACLGAHSIWLVFLAIGGGIAAVVGAWLWDRP